MIEGLSGGTRRTDLGKKNRLFADSDTEDSDFSRTGRGCLDRFRKKRVKFFRDELFEA
jgi:hypothetical protein